MSNPGTCLPGSHSRWGEAVAFGLGLQSALTATNEQQAQGSPRKQLMPTANQVDVRTFLDEKAARAED
jgi:hypothetical protein